MRFIERCALAVAVLMSSLNCVGAEEPIELETIPILKVDNVYQGSKSRLVWSESDVDDLIDELFANCRRLAGPFWGEQSSEVDERRQIAFNKRVGSVRKAISEADIDFDKEAVAVVFLASSGSVRFRVGEPRLVGDVLTLAIERNSPTLQTADMVFRAFAIRVPRDIAQRVRVPVDRNTYRTYDLATGEEIVEDAGKSEVAPKAAASPQR
jgi:hypothetical protein